VQSLLFINNLRMVVLWHVYVTYLIEQIGPHGPTRVMKTTELNIYDGNTVRLPLVLLPLTKPCVCSYKLASPTLSIIYTPFNENAKKPVTPSQSRRTVAILCQSSDITASYLCMTSPTLFSD